MNTNDSLKGILPREVFHSLPESGENNMPEQALYLQDKKFEALAHPRTYAPRGEYDARDFEVPEWLNPF